MKRDTVRCCLYMGFGVMLGAQKYEGYAGGLARGLFVGGFVLLISTLLEKLGVF